MVDQNRNQEIDRQEVVQREAARRNPADNLTRDARIRGGERSARLQQRDARGQFAGSKQKESNVRTQSRTNAGRSAGEPTPESE